MKSKKDVLDGLSYQGITIAEWAREHGFSRRTVYAVLNGRRKASSGVGHQIAVRLGMKDGVVRDGEGNVIEFQGGVQV
ncbi:MAG: DNA-binding protein [Magnetococcales bacterium]|nr:DNA-binding protein [Magnetococcales bacterium]